MSLRPFQLDDLSRLAEIECQCSLTDPLAQYLAVDMRKNWSAHIKASVQFLAKKLLEPGCVCWVITVPERSAEIGTPQKLVAWAIWTKHSINHTPNDKVTTLSLASAKALENHCHSMIETAIFDQTNRAKVEHIIYRSTVPPKAGLDDYWELDGMYVDPKFQRQGLGRKLLQWGTEEARLENVPIVTKSSPVGIYLYEQNGFKSYKEEDFAPFFHVGHKGMHLMFWDPSENSNWFEILRLESAAV